MNRETLIVLAAAGGLAAGGALFAAMLAPPPRPPVQAAVAPPAPRPTLADLSARVAEEPEDVEAWRALGRLHMAEGRYLRAVEAWTWIKELRPRDPEAASALAELERIARERRSHTVPAPDAAPRPPR